MSLAPLAKVCVGIGPVGMSWLGRVTGHSYCMCVYIYVFMHTCMDGHRYGYVHAQGMLSYVHVG